MSQCPILWLPSLHRQLVRVMVRTYKRLFSLSSLVGGLFKQFYNYRFPILSWLQLWSSVFGSRSVWVCCHLLVCNLLDLFASVSACWSVSIQLCQRLLVCQPHRLLATFSLCWSVSIWVCQRLHMLVVFQLVLVCQCLGLLASPYDGRLLACDGLLASQSFSLTVCLASFSSCWSVNIWGCLPLRLLVVFQLVLVC